MRLLIGFGSKCRQGKDLAAQAIQSYFDGAEIDEQVQIFKFADALYDLCRKNYDMKEKDPRLLQKVGIEKRQKNPDFWVDRMFSQADNFDGIALVTDVRFKNEAAAIKKRGGFLVNVSTLNDDGSPYISDDRPADHESETDLDGYRWDAFIKTYRNDEALAAELAITLANYYFRITEPESTKTTEF
jgi:hypothetical protein